MKKLIGVLFLLLAAAGGAAYYRFNRVEVDTGRLFASGTIEATEVELAFNQSGLVEAVLFDEGDQVDKGREVARLDSRRLQRSLEEAQRAVAVAQAQLPLIEVSLKQAEGVARSRLAQAAAAVALAQARLEEAQAGRTKAGVEQDRAGKDWARIDPLFRQGSATARQRDDSEAALEQARSSVAQAEANLAQARASLAQARADEDLARAQALEPDRLRQELAVAGAQVAQAQAQAAVLERTLAETVITAPLSGRVISRNIEPGEVVSPGTGVLTIADLEHVWLRAYVPEFELGRIKLGQEVEVAVDSYPGRRFLGRLAFISDQAEFTPKAVQTKDERVKLVFRIKVELDNRELRLKPGMPADGWIMLESK